VGGRGEERGGERKKKQRGRRWKGRRRGGEWGVSRSPLESIIKSVTVTFLWEKQSDITRVRDRHNVLRLWNVVRRYQTFTTYQLQYVEQLYNNSQRFFHFSPRCLSTDVSPIVFKGLMCCHCTVRPARVQEKGVLKDILKGLSKDRF